MNEALCRNLWHWAIGLALCLALGGCFLEPLAGSDPADPQPPANPEPEPQPEPTPDPDPPPPAFSFVLPADGSTVTAPMLLSASGDGITAVRFLVDDVQIFEDTTQPHEWTLNPGSFAKGDHVVSVRVVHAGGEDARSVNVTLSPAPSGPDQPQSVFDAVANLQPGHWYEIPNTNMRPLRPLSGVGGSVAGVQNAWSGGAFDTKRNRLVCWGGGHGDYSGNELYVFDLNTLKWSRITDPSPFPPGDPDNDALAVSHPDGRPVSRHTYNYLTYMPPPVDRFFSGGGSGLWKSGQFEDPSTRLFDFDRLEWETRAEVPVYGIAAICAVAPDGRVWQLSQDGGYLAVYDATKDTWTKHNYWKDVIGWLGYTYTAAVDPVHNRFLLVGKGMVRAWDLDNPDANFVVLSTQGDRAIEGGAYIGLAYHPASERIVAWDGGADVYTMDVDTLTWTRHATSGSVSPGPAVATGTFGRFRYSPKNDVFVLANGVDSNIFVYRLPPK